jgi:hypothetical protein
MAREDRGVREVGVVAVGVGRVRDPLLRAAAVTGKTGSIGK